MVSNQFDIIIIGGGLAGCLALNAIKHTNPKIRILLIEKNHELAGNHTWSFHEADLPESCQAWLRPLITHSWQGYWVHFPTYSREFNSPYHSITSEDLRQKTMDRFGKSVALKTEVLSTTRDEDLGIHVVTVLPEGAAEPIALQAETVLLARGWTEHTEPVAWQKFVGLDIELEEPHNLHKVVLMDARIQQIDGYRFFYLLPWTPTRLLIEDTYYSHHPGLKTERIEQEIHAYVQKQNWKIKSITRHESGALPLTLALPSGTKQSRDIFPSIGAESGYFHPVTGYTAPTLLKQLCAICDHSNLTASAMTRVLGKVEHNSVGRLRYYRFLNRMMFKGAEPTERYKVLSHFYRMPEPVITRFYSGDTTIWDQLRILMGKPPVPVAKALRLLREKT